MSDKEHDCYMLGMITGYGLATFNWWFFPWFYDYLQGLLI